MFDRLGKKKTKHPSSSSSPCVVRSIESTKAAIASFIASVGKRLCVVMRSPLRLKRFLKDGNDRARISSAKGSWQLKVSD